MLEHIIIYLNHVSIAYSSHLVPGQLRSKQSSLAGSQTVFNSQEVNNLTSSR